MSLLDPDTLRGLTPSRLWSRLDPETKQLAARAVYSPQEGEESGRREADAAIAGALRFRPLAVRKLPLDRRVGYLLKAVRVDDTLASTLLLALHLAKRRPMLRTFLDRLEVPHEDGVIRAERFQAPAAEEIGPAVDALYESFDREEVDVYLATLIAMEPESWEALREALERRA